MNFRQLTSSLLSATLLMQSIAPSFAMEPAPQEERAKPTPSFVLKNSLSRSHRDRRAVDSHTAAGIFHYATHNGEIYALLGKRDDSGHQDAHLGKWCNFGGKSDAIDRTLADTAARESSEESNGIYAPHPRLLRHSPFIDLIAERSGNNLLYRLYFQKVQFVSADVLNTKSKKATKAHNREFEDHKWVKVSTILSAITSNNPIISEENLCLYQPLFETLSTTSGIAFLTSLTKLKKLNPFSNAIRPLCNQIYGNKEMAFDFLTSKPALPSEDDILAEAVAAHGMAQVQIKQRSQKKITPEYPVPSSSWDPHCGETITRIHLRLVLGSQYKEVTNFAQHPNPQRAADLHNLKIYYSKYNDAEYHQKHGNKDRKIDPQDFDFETMADILDWESQNKQWPSFQHGGNEGISNLIKSSTYLRELIRLSPLGETKALRATDIYFGHGKTLWEMLKKTGAVENSKTSSAMLFCNVSAIANIETSKTTSSSFEYFLNDHSVTDQNVNNRFAEAMALAGFSNPVYTYFHSLFEQFYKNKHDKFGNSIFLVATLNPHLLDDYVYSCRGGDFYNNSRGEKISSTSETLRRIQFEYNYQQRNGIENFNVDCKDKKDLFPEFRFYLHPSRALDPNSTLIKTFDRFPLNSADEKVYDEQMRQITVAFLADWLSQKAMVLEGAFDTFPALKTLYHFAYEKVTETKLTELPSHDGLLYLMKNNNWDSVNEYVKTYPDALNSELFNPENLTKKILTDDSEFYNYTSHQMEVIHWMIKNHPQFNLKQLAKIENEKGKTLLHVAAEYKDKTLIQMLLENGADVNHLNMEGQSPIFKVLSYDKEYIEPFLNHSNINLNICDKYGCSILTLALLSYYGEDTVPLILDHQNFDLYQFDPHAKISAENIPLIYFLASEVDLTTDMLEVVINHPNFDFKQFHEPYKGGDTAFIRLLEHEKDIIKLVKKHQNFDLNQFNPNITIEKEYEVNGSIIKEEIPFIFDACYDQDFFYKIAKIFLEHPNLDSSQLNYIAPDGMSLLAQVLEYSTPQFAQMILDHKNFNPNINEGSILLQAINDHSIDIIKMILDHKKFDILQFNPNAIIEIYPLIGGLIVQERVPLFYYACKTNAPTDILKLILSHPRFEASQLNFISKAGETPFSLTLSFYMNDVAEMILNHKHFNPNFKNGIMLFQALKRQSTECIKMIMEHAKFDPLQFNPNLMIRNSVYDSISRFDEQVPLIYYMSGYFRNNYLYEYNAQKEILKLILSHPRFESSQLNFISKSGETSLHSAINYANQTVISKLLQHPDIDPDMKNSNGETALYKAILSERNEIAQLLMQHPKIDLIQARRDLNTALNSATPYNQKKIIEFINKHLQKDQ